MTDPLQCPTHVVVGDERHGVNALAKRLALELGAELIKVDAPAALLDALTAAHGVHLHFTDRIFGSDPGAAASLIERVSPRVARLSLTLHDLPQPSDGRSFSRRAAAYARVCAAASVVVLNSEHERQLAYEAGVLPRAPRVGDPVSVVIPLPLQTSVGPAHAPVEGAGPPRSTGVRERGAGSEEPDTGREQHGAGTADQPADRAGVTVGLFGFVYPGKGYEEVIDAAAATGLPVAVRLLGQASAGHEDLVDELRDRALAADVSIEQVGFLPPEAVVPQLRAVDVPVVFHQHFSASGSLNSWIAAGRRPLVIDTRYTREMDRLRPGTLTLVHRHALTAAILEAAAHPDTTWGAVDAGTDDGETERGYRELFAHTARVFGARHREVESPKTSMCGHSMGSTSISVVIPFYDPEPRDSALRDSDPRTAEPRSPARGHLDRVIRAARADAPQAQIIVVDDGSPVPLQYRDVTVLRQADEGFRAAAARNLGARAACGDVIVFLDADTVPQAGFFAAVCEPLRAGSAQVAVGTRLHPGSTGWVPVGWLEDGYAHTQNLVQSNASSYRFVISAVVAVPRALILAQPFDETLVGYGGEDWEAAHRWWQAGARLVHVPHAIAHHDEPDWAGRGGRDDAQQLSAKNGESRALAARIAAAWTRPSGVRFLVPECVVEVLTDAPGDQLIDWIARLLSALPDSVVRLNEAAPHVVELTSGPAAAPAGPQAAGPPAAPTGVQPASGDPTADQVTARRERHARVLEFFTGDSRVQASDGGHSWGSDGGAQPRHYLRVHELFHDVDSIVEAMRTLDSASETGAFGGINRRARFTVEGRLAAELASARARALEEHARTLPVPGGGVVREVRGVPAGVDLERTWARW